MYTKTTARFIYGYKRAKPSSKREIFKGHIDMYIYNVDIETRMHRASIVSTVYIYICIYILGVSPPSSSEIIIFPFFMKGPPINLHFPLFVSRGYPQSIYIYINHIINFSLASSEYRNNSQKPMLSSSPTIPMICHPSRMVG